MSKVKWENICKIFSSCLIISKDISNFARQRIPSVGYQQAKEHALEELKKFKDCRLSQAEEDYMETIRELNQKAKKGIKK